ncbi:MAG: methyltransferase domain-containing protein [Pseudomonas marincola]
MVSEVLGTKGYAQVSDAFVKSTRLLTFDTANRDFSKFVPTNPCRVLDAGSGAGQNAAALAMKGHRVTAVEPLLEFRSACLSEYGDLGIEWINDAFPSLEKLGNTPAQFDFILVDAVWHHLNETERAQSLTRLDFLLDEGGFCALSLRNGPAGVGTHLFPTDSALTAALAAQLGLEVLLHLVDQPSILPNKPDVKWTRLVFQKPIR